MNYLKIPLGHKVTHSLDHPDGFSVWLGQSGKKENPLTFKLLHKSDLLSQT